MSAAGGPEHEIEGYRGLGRRQPALALCFAILLLAQAGAPFTTGFLAKLYVVQSAVQSHSYALAVIAMLSGAIAAAFYLRVVFVMYGSREASAMPESVPPGPATSELLAAGTSSATVTLARAAEPEADTGLETAAVVEGRVEVPALAQLGLFLTVGFTVVLGIWPAPLFSFVHAARLLF